MSSYTYCPACRDHHGGIPDPTLDVDTLCCDECGLNVADAIKVAADMALLDKILREHPDFCVECLGPEWIGYTWFGPAGEECDEVKGTFHHVITELAKRSGANGRATP